MNIEQEIASRSWSKPCFALSIDGGGVRGIFPAAFLDYFERSSSFMGNMSLLAGTSTGAIIAVALALGVSPREVRELYVKVGGEVFGKKRNIVRRALGSPAYDGSVLRRVLGGVKKISKRMFGECKPRTLIPSICRNSRELVIFDSEKPEWADVPAVDIIAASAAAPFYFATCRVKNRDFVDGGLGCNNPAWQAARVALDEMKVPMGRLRLLSLGTGQVPTTLPLLEGDRMSAPSRVKEVVEICMQTSSRFAEEQCRSIFGNTGGAYYRISPDLDRHIRLDDCGGANSILLPEADRLWNEHKGRLNQWLNPTE